MAQEKTPVFLTFYKDLYFDKKTNLGCMEMTKIHIYKNINFIFGIFAICDVSGFKKWQQLSKKTHCQLTGKSLNSIWNANKNKYQSKNANMKLKIEKKIVKNKF